MVTGLTRDIVKRLFDSVAKIADEVRINHSINQCVTIYLSVAAEWQQFS